MLWILLPAYNEQESIPKLLPKIDEVLTNKEISYRIVVLDDGSIDITAPLVNRYSQNIPIDLISHSLNRGLGETERDGFEYIVERCQPDDIVIRMDCDDTHEPEYIGTLIEKLHEGYDVVNTSRFQPGGAQKGVDTYRAMISRAANVFMKLMFRIPGIRDYSCGYRAYRGRILQDAIRVYGNDFIQLRGLGFTSTLEMLVKLHLLGCRFAEVPFVLRYDQKSSSSKMIGSVTTLGYIVMTILYYWPLGGWMKHYKGLDVMYRQDPQQACDIFSNHVLPRRSVSRISL